MSVDLLLAVAGVIVTVMVVAGMFLIVPSGVEAAPAHQADPVEDEVPATDAATQRPVPEPV